jgi:hypothetical protein
VSKSLQVRKNTEGNFGHLGTYPSDTPPGLCEPPTRTGQLIDWSGSWLAALHPVGRLLVCCSQVEFWRSMCAARGVRIRMSKPFGGLTKRVVRLDVGCTTSCLDASTAAHPIEARGDQKSPNFVTPLRGNDLVLQGRRTGGVNRISNFEPANRVFVVRRTKFGADNTRRRQTH